MNGANARNARDVHRASAGVSGLTAAEVADRLARDSNPRVADWIRLARQRGKGEELRLLTPLVAAGLVDERAGGSFALTLAGRRAVRDMLATPHETVATGPQARLRHAS